MVKNIPICCALIFIAFFTACSEEGIKDPYATDKDLPATQRMNEYTEQVMKSVYLWAGNVRSRQVDRDLPSDTFFYRLKYDAADKWSYIDNTSGSPSADTDGTDNKYGYYLAFYLDMFGVYAQVCYVYPGSPAAKAGLKRGDIILRKNGVSLNTKNYQSLYGTSGITLSVGTIENYYNESLPVNNIQLTPQKITINPILVDTIIQYNGKKIGYLHYTEFADNKSTSLYDLKVTISRFKQAGIDEFILDLRYNQGGYLTAARQLCSLLAPEADVSNEAILIKKEWNEEYQQKYKGQSAYMEERLDRRVLAENLNLKRMYAIVSDKTASASELVISGLRPYIPEITLIGTTTHGKNAASISYTPNDSDISHWTLHPIVFEYRNAAGESVKGGISPTYSQKESYSYLKPLGDIEEPLLKTALALIAGNPPVSAARSSETSKKLESVYDRQHNRLIAE